MGEAGTLTRHTIVYSLAGVLNRLPGFLLVPLYTRFLDPRDFGALGVISITSEIVGASIGLKLGTAMSRLYFEESRPSGRNAIVTTAIIGTIALMAIATGLFWIVATPFSEVILKEPGMGGPLMIGLTGLLLNSLFTLGLQYVQIRQRSDLFLLISTLRSVVYLAATAFFVAGLRLGLQGAVIGILVGNGLAAVGLLVPLLSRLGFRFSMSRFRSLLRFGAPLVPGQLAEVGGAFTERYLIVHLLSLVASGVYYLALRAASLVNALLIGPFGRVFLVRRFEAFEAGAEDKDAVRSFTYFFLVVTAGALGLAIMAPEVVRVLGSKGYEDAARVIPLLSLTQVLTSILLVAELGIYYAKVPRHITTATIAGFVAQLLLGVALIPGWGIQGAAAAATAGSAIRIGVTIHLSRSCGGMMPEWRVIGTMLGAAIATYGVSTLTGGFTSWTGTLARAALVIVYPLAMLASPLFTSAERRSLAVYIRSGILQLRLRPSPAGR